MDSFRERIADQISAYEIFNHIIPGAVYLILADRFTAFSLLTGYVITDIITFYFAGVVIGRIGSLLIEPAMDRIKNRKCLFFLDRAPYIEFIRAEGKDEQHKLQQLVMAHNMYRSLTAGTMLLLFTILFDWVWSIIPTCCVFRKVAILDICLFLALLFLCSMSKQSKRIKSRIDYLNEEKKNGERK